MQNNSENFYYTVYGLNINSHIQIPDLVEDKNAPNVSISYGKLTELFLRKNLKNCNTYQNPGRIVKVSERCLLYDWRKVGKIFISNGSEVIVDPLPGVDAVDLQPFLTGPILTILLQQRGLLVLHGCSVVINGKAIALLGAKGFGKSTLAAYLQSKGHKLLSDDIVPLNFINNEIITSAGYPRVKLFADSVIALGANPNNFPFIHRFVEKYSFHSANGFSSESMKLDSIYILSESENVSISKLNRISAFIEITKFTHANRYFEGMKSQERHFVQNTKLTERIPVFKLNRPHNFNKIDEVRSLLETHLNN